MEKVGDGCEVAIVTFEDVTILNPRGYNYTVEFHLSFLRIRRENEDFKIPYTSILEIFVLPKCKRPFTFVVITLDPSVNNCQTLFPHTVIQFGTYNVVEKFLVINQDLCSSIYKDKLEPSYKGLIHEVFTNILQGFCTCKLTKAGEYGSDEDSYGVVSSLKDNDGLLYPLEKCFCFLPVPPTVIYYNEIQCVKFGRQFQVGPNMHFFDLVIKLKTHQEHLFYAIPRKEYLNLFDFIRSKDLDIKSLKSVEETLVEIEASTFEQLNPL